MQPSLPFTVGDRVELDYTNYRGERSIRLVEILPAGVTFGRSKHHPDEQWFLSATDVARDVERDFAMKDIHGFKVVKRAEPELSAAPPTNTIYREAYNDRAERVLYGARSSFEPAEDCRLQDLALETKYAIRRGNYNRRLLVMLLELVCEKSVEWAFLLDVLRERCRQINEEGYTEAHDIDHDPGQLAAAAACYACAEHPTVVGYAWPWEHEAWKPRGEHRNHIIAAALLLAEGEAYDRVSSRPPDVVLP